SVCDGDHRVVEAGVHMGDTRGDVLAFAPADALRFWVHGRVFLGSGQHAEQGIDPQAASYFFLPAIGFALPLRVRALVWVRWPRTGRPRRWRSARVRATHNRRLHVIAAS